MDKKILKILEELDKNSRVPASSIAKKVKLSKVAVNNNITKLYKEGIIHSFLTQVNYKKLGHNITHIFYKHQNLPAQKEEEFYNFLTQNKNIGYVARCEGSQDTFVVVIHQNIDELDEILSKINKLFGIFLKHRTILPVVFAQYYGRRYLNYDESVFTPPIIRKQVLTQYKLEDVDHRILQSLSETARISVIDLAKKLKISIDMAHYHLKKLISDGVIQKFTININHEKFGNSFYKALIMLNSNMDEKEFVSKISANKQVIRAIRLLGQWNIEIDFEVKDNKEIRNIIKKIKEEHGKDIDQLELLFVYSIDKLNYYPF